MSSAPFRCSIIGLFALVTFSFGFAWGIEVSQETAAEHLTKRIEPVYPPIAKAARLQGKVLGGWPTLV